MVRIPAQTKVIIKLGVNLNKITLQLGNQWIKNQDRPNGKYAFLMFDETSMIRQKKIGSILNFTFTGPSQIIALDSELCLGSWGVKDLFPMKANNSPVPSQVIALKRSKPELGSPSMGETWRTQGMRMIHSFKIIHPPGSKKLKHSSTFPYFDPFLCYPKGPGWDREKERTGADHAWHFSTVSPREWNKEKQFYLSFYLLVKLLLPWIKLSWS